MMRKEQVAQKVKELVKMERRIVEEKLIVKSNGAWEGQKDR